MAALDLYDGMPIINDTTAEEHHSPAEFGRGLVLANRGNADDYAYDGVAEQFPAALLIDTSEFQARIQERIAKQATLRDKIKLQGVKSKNQKQTNFCHQSDTEVLTERGWVQWPSYNGSDLLATMNPVTRMMEFQKPSHFHAIEHDGQMVYSKNSSVDFAVTPDHRMLVRRWDEGKRKLSDQYTFAKAGDMGWYFGLPHAPLGHIGPDFKRLSIEGDREYEGDDFVALMSLIVSDGYAGGTENTRNWVSFARFSNHDKDEVRALAARNGFTECPSRPGVWIRYDASALANWIRANAYLSPELGAHNKRVPEFVKHASSRQISLFMRLYGDQSHTKIKGGEYFSTSKRVVDDLQEMMLRVGKRGTVWSKDNTGKIAVLENGQVATSRHPLHYVHERSGDELSMLNKKHLETDKHKGTVFCATVPNSTLITRRSGTVLISGNCWANGPCHAVELMRMLQGQPYVELSAASVACPINGYRNQGGWGLQALQRLADFGAVPASIWPNAVISRQFDVPSNWIMAKQYRVIRWGECKPRNIQQLVSLLLQDIPVAVGYNWWSHEVTACDVQWIDGTVAIVIRNQWWPDGQHTWGDDNFAVLQGSKMLPDDAVFPMSAVPSGVLAA